MFHSSSKKSIALLNKSRLVLIFGSISGCFSFFLIFFLLQPYIPKLLIPIPEISFSRFHSSGNSFTAQAGSLSIPKIQVQAPIVTGVSAGSENLYLDALTRGIALASESAPLDSFTGNSFLFAHSSQLNQTPSPYDSIFAKLPDLVPGDTITIQNGYGDTTYEVYTSHVAEVDQVEFIDRNSAGKQITLATCWPIGTNWKRWVVQAKKKI